MSLSAWWRNLSRGVLGLRDSARLDREDRDELQHFVDETSAHLRASGMSEQEAQRAARLQVGHATVVRETVRAARWESTVSSFAADVRYALRMLRRSPVFSIVIVLVLSLGIGAVTTMFSAGNAFLYRPLPGASAPSELVGIDRIKPGTNEGTQATYPYYTLLRDQSRTLSGVAAFAKTNLTISAAGQGFAVYGNLVSGNYFNVLGVRPALGRFFVPVEDSTPLAHPVIVVSHAFWRTALGGDSALVGKTVGVNGRNYTLIGVAPETFRGAQGPIVTSAWVPIMMLPHIRPNASLTSNSASFFWVFGRMKPDATREAVRQDLLNLLGALVASRVEPEWLQKNNGIRIIGFNGLPDDAQRTMKAFTGVLLGVAFLVLLIACVNVAAMLSARALARKHEMAIRVALGAAKARVVRQLITESLVLFAIGAVGGVLVAIVGTWALERIPLPDAVPLSLELSPDWRVFIFALAVALFTGLVFGLAPALQAAKVDIQSRLRGDTRTGGSGRGWLNNTLVVGQLAMSLVLLVSAGLLVRALARGAGVNPGFNAQNVAVTTLKGESWGYDEAKLRVFYQALRDRLENAPGVTNVTYVDRLPLQLSSGNDRIVVDGAPAGTDGKPQQTSVQLSIVDANYFDVLQLTVVTGRAIERGDNEQSARVAVVNEEMARKNWATTDAIGRTFTLHDQRITVVGVAKNAKYASLTEDMPSVVYLPVAQEFRKELALMIRSSASIVVMSDAVREAVRAIDPALPRPEIVSLTQATSFVLLPQRVAAGVTAALGLLGLLLATVGLYGTISYTVSLRARELGVRMALGARAIDVQRLVVVRGMRLAGLGVVVGLLLAAGASQLLVAYLYGVSPLDIPTFAVTSLIFLSVAFMASYLPARRAAALDPLVVLRQQ